MTTKMETNPYRVTLKAMVEVEIEVDADNEDQAKDKAYHWTGGYPDGYTEIGWYTVHHDDDTEDDIYDDQGTYWKIQNVEFEEYVSVLELDEDDEEDNHAQNG